MVLLLMFAITISSMFLASRIFAKSLVGEEGRGGMIMELPPYHKPKWSYIFRTTLDKAKDIFCRAFRVILLVSLVFYLLSYNWFGTESILSKVGQLIAPVTEFFGMSWQMFMAYLSSMMTKESLLGVLNALYSNTDMVTAAFNSKSLGLSESMMELLPQADFWQRVGFSAGHILLGFALGVVVSVLLAAAAERWAWVDTLLAPVIQLVKATPVASFIILALVWVSGRSLSILISFLMVLPVLYSAVRTGIESADVQLLEMAQVFHLPLVRRVKAIWLPAILPAFRQGCSVALGICWKSGVAAEVIGLPDGSIGDALYRAKITLSTGELFAWTFVIILLSAVFEKLFLALLDKAVAAVLGEEGAEK